MAISAIVLLGARAGLSRAEIYRCTDSNGHVVFTQQHCAAGQSSERVNMEGLNDLGSKLKSDAKVCTRIKELADLVFPHITDTESILDIYTDLGGRKNLSAGVTAAVNYVFNFRYNPKARRSDVVELTYAKCLDGGFGRIREKDLPAWEKITYAKEKKKTDQAEAREKTEQRDKLAGDCAQFRKNLIRLQQRMASARDKGAKLQARVDLEYNRQQLKDKCGDKLAK
jgi:hypothetical protein